MVQRGLLWWFLLSLCGPANCDDPDELLKSSIAKHGYPVELHKVTTEDGYILTNARIPNPRNTPLLIMHGLFGCSVDFTAQGPGKALALLAHDAGFDVWLANNRGTTYSKKHESLDLKSRAYWRFSFHELGLYDLSAIVDYTVPKNNVIYVFWDAHKRSEPNDVNLCSISNTLVSDSGNVDHSTVIFVSFNIVYVLKHTRRKKLQFLAHSQGGGQFLVLTTLRPEYNDVFISAHLSSPVAYLHHATSPAVILTTRPEEIEAGARLTGLYVDAIVQATRKGLIPLDLILINVWYVMGYHDSFNRTMFLDLLRYSPAGGSVYQVLHYIQLHNAKSFQQYDFGSAENLQRYGAVRPPLYPLPKVTTPTYVYYGKSDNIIQPPDVHALADQLPNLRLRYKIPDRRWNHLDFLYASSAHRLYRMILGKMGSPR